MDCISELKDSLNIYFGWNKARMACFANILLALFATRTVNLNKLACVVFGEAQQSSRYRRIQRFFSKFPLDYQQIAGFIFKLFFVKGGQWYLSMDRTNWRWGKSDINILMLGIVFKGTAIPIYWIFFVILWFDWRIKPLIFNKLLKSSIPCHYRPLAPNHL